MKTEDNQVGQGAKIARDALAAMEKETASEERVASEAEEFVNECEKSGRSAIDVVSFVAGKSGVRLSEPRPEDEEKGRLHDLLKAAVGVAVRRDVLNAGSPRAGICLSDLSEDDGFDDYTQLVARNKPVRKGRVFGYAFTW